MIMYIVKYNYGSYDDFTRINVFVTNDEEKAKAYVEKFNAILKKWKEYWKQYENEDGWMEDEDKFQKWLRIADMGKAYYCEIEVR